jgi:hypothetical protein
MTEAPDVYPDLPDDDPEPDDEGVEGRAREEASAASLRTGDPRVDAVLDLLAGLDERPIGEHIAALERIHEGLRAALEPDRETA